MAKKKTAAEPTTARERVAARKAKAEANREKKAGAAGTPNKINVNYQDANSVINAQNQENQQTALANNQMNNPNISGIGVGRTVTYDPKTGMPTTTVNMGAPETAAYNRFMEQASQPVDFSQLPAMPGDFSADRQRIEDELYNREAGRLNEQFGQAQQDFDRTMSAKGIPIGSPLYNKQLDQFQRQKQEAFSGARQNAIQTAGGESQRMFGNALQGRQQAMSELDYGRTQPFNQFSGLMGLGANISGQFGQFQGSQQAPTDIGGIAASYNSTAQAGRSAGAGQMTQADRMALQNNQYDRQAGLLAMSQDYAQRNKPKQNGFGDAVAGIGAGFAGGFASEFGEGLGNQFSKWMAK